jgi:hypothetical protein
MTLPEKKQYEQQEAERQRILARYFNVPSIAGDNRQLVRRFLFGAIWAAVLVPLLFYLKFGVVGWFAIGFTVFLVTLSLLFAVGLYFQNKTEYHTRVPMEGSVADRIGAFWLVACAFGPFFGWSITAFPLTESSWRWQYLARAFPSVILPVITAVPLIGYARGKAALIASALLLGITALPVLSCVWVLADLHDGAKTVTVTVIKNGPNVNERCQEADSSKLPCDYSFREGDNLQMIWCPTPSESYHNRNSRVDSRSPVPHPKSRRPTVLITNAVGLSFFLFAQACA